MKRYFFQIPAEHRCWVKTKIGELHHQRLGIVVPLLMVVGLVFLVLDALMLQEEGSSGLIWGYVVLDLVFFLVHAGFSLWLRGDRKATPDPVIYAYLTFVLAWSAWTGNIEFQRSGNFTTMFLTLLGVSALGLFSLRGITALLIVALSLYSGLNLLWPGPTVQGLDKYAALFALPFLAFAVSRTLYAAVVRNLITTFELERANSQLKEARLNLIRQDKLASLGVLSAGIAHEINNPLAFIKSNVAALDRNLAVLHGPPEVIAENQTILEETREGFRRIGEVIQALSTFSRDLPPGASAPYDLNQGIRTTLVMTRHETAADIVVDTDLVDLPAVPARESELNQVLLNLLMNAFQAVRSLPPGEVRLVMVRTRLEADAVVAEISNSGPPIPPGVREKIFDPFFSTKGPGAGMGLGLSLSWQIVVNRHQGDLELLDREPVTFRLRLPRTLSGTQSATQST